MIANVCHCLYRMEKGRFYPKTYVEYVNDALNGFCFHLDDVIIAKKNDCVVFSYIFCVKKISEKLIMFPDYPENIDNVGGVFGTVLPIFIVCFHVIYKDSVEELRKIISGAL